MCLYILTWIFGVHSLDDLQKVLGLCNRIGVKHLWILLFLYSSLLILCNSRKNKKGKPVVFTYIQNQYRKNNPAFTCLPKWISNSNVNLLLIWIISDSHHIGWVSTQRKLSSRMRWLSYFLWKTLNLLLVEYILLLYSFA